jgi:arylsulfatase A-like enzyme
LKRILNPRLIPLLALASALHACRAPEPVDPPQSKPNVLLITIETLRADHSAIYGYSRNTTPNLDRVGQQGAVFMQAIAQAPFTLPSLASVMTGRTPPAHGVRNHPAALRPELTTLAEHLAGAGYDTAAMTRHSWLKRRSGFDQGFDEYYNNKFWAGLDARSLSLAAIEWLRRHQDNPFFLWLHFIDPHLPYTPGYPYSVLYHPDYQDDSKVQHVRSMIEQPRDDFRPSPYADLSGGPYLDLVLPHYPGNPILLDLATRQRQRVEIFFGKVRYPEPAIEQIRDLYDGALVYTDDNLARLLRALSEIGLEKNTVVVVAGDHGEALGDHGLYFTHDFTLYDEVLRVPLVVRMPGRIAPGTTVAQQVRLMDIAPTLLELADLDVPEDMEGVSLVPLLENRSLPYLKAFAESAPKRPLFSGQPRVYYDGNKGKWRMVRDDRWKLILIPHPDGDIFELYDLVSDPGETRNLYEELPGEAAKLWPSLQEWMRKDPDREANRTAEETEALEELDPATRQQLEVLGYINNLINSESSTIKDQS